MNEAERELVRITVEVVELRARLAPLERRQEELVQALAEQRTEDVREQVDRVVGEAARRLEKPEAREELHWWSRFRPDEMIHGESTYRLPEHTTLTALSKLVPCPGRLKCGKARAGQTHGHTADGQLV